MDRMHADIDLKRAQTSWEPWKAMVAVVTASAAVFGSLGVIIGYLLGIATSCR
jgi:hypothetical protein